ncbi:MAG TPA: flagellar hook-basal body complex protein FliE [Actinomycetota bacterium]|nr:flagellar hook-basal body complex protein FliE [Actinomycetota bacterium]
MAVDPITSPPPVAEISAGRRPVGSPPADGVGFGELVRRGLEAVSESERKADALIQAMARGRHIQPHEVMIATAEAALSVQLAVAVRDKALEAYREIMSLQL